MDYKDYIKENKMEKIIVRILFLIITLEVKNFQIYNKNLETEHSVCFYINVKNVEILKIILENNLDVIHFVDDYITENKKQRMVHKILKVQEKIKEVVILNLGISEVLFLVLKKQLSVENYH